MTISSLKLPQKPRPYVMAHRGNSELCPENTLAAFRMAVEDGTDIIETDLHISVDGELMCIHDDTLDRTTNGTGPVKTRTATELQAYSASYGRAGFEAEYIPTLHEVLAILPESVGIALELKDDDFVKAEHCQKLSAVLNAAGMQGRVVVLSFKRELLEAVGQFAPEIPTGLITLLGFFPEAGWLMTGPLWPTLFLNPFYVWIGHRRGQFICPLDPTPDARLWYYKLLGCDAVLTNNPAQTRARLGQQAL